NTVPKSAPEPVRDGSFIQRFGHSRPVPQLEMSQMKNIPSLVVLSFSVAAGAAFLSCTSFSSGPENGMGGSGSGETGGPTGVGMVCASDNGTGGMTTTGEGGATTGMGGSTTGMGGSTTGMGGSTTGMGG